MSKKKLKKKKKKSQALKFRKALTAKMWKEKENSL